MATYPANGSNVDTWDAALYTWLTESVFAADGSMKTTVDHELKKITFIDATYDVNTICNAYGVVLTSYRDATYNTYSAIDIYRSRGSEATPAAVQDGDWALKWRFYGHDGTAWEQYGGFIYDLYDVSAEKGKFVFYDFDGGANYFFEMGPEHIKFGDVNGSDYMEYDPVNDLLFFVGNSGMAHGSMYADDAAQTVTVSAANTAYEVAAGFTTGEVKDVTFGGAHYLVATKAGKYKVEWSLSVNSATVDNEVKAGLMIGGTENAKGTARTVLPVANAPGHLSGCTILDLAASDQVSLFVENATNTDDIVMEHGNLNMIQIAGT